MSFAGTEAPEGFRRAGAARQAFKAGVFKFAEGKQFACAGIGRNDPAASLNDQYGVAAFSLVLIWLEVRRPGSRTDARDQTQQEEGKP